MNQLVLLHQRVLNPSICAFGLHFLVSCSQCTRLLPSQSLTFVLINLWWCFSFLYFFGWSALICHVMSNWLHAYLIFIYRFVNYIKKLAKWIQFMKLISIHNKMHFQVLYLISDNFLWMDYQWTVDLHWYFYLIDCMIKLDGAVQGDWGKLLPGSSFFLEIVSLLLPAGGI